MGSGMFSTDMATDYDSVCIVPTMKHEGQTFIDDVQILNEKMTPGKFPNMTMIPNTLQMSHKGF